MNKNKSMIVTAIFAVMLLGILASLYKLWTVGFYIFAGIFALYGVVLFTFRFFHWLCSDGKAEEELRPPVVEGDPVTLGDDFKPTYDAILYEIQNETL